MIYEYVMRSVSKVCVIFVNIDPADQNFLDFVVFLEEFSKILGAPLED